MGRGNHDTNIINRYGTDLIDRLAEKMRMQHDGLTVAGGSGGWVRFMFEQSAQGGRRSILMKYFHGTGGGALMTHGTLDTRRQGSYLPDADIVYDRFHLVMNVNQAVDEVRRDQSRVADK